jgi:hypothetical protein
MATKIEELYREYFEVEGNLDTPILTSDDFKHSDVVNFTNFVLKRITEDLNKPKEDEQRTG